MQPPLSARPRPPARRNTSKGKFTALPAPTTPRRRRQSQLDPDGGGPKLSADTGSKEWVSSPTASSSAIQHGVPLDEHHPANELASARQSEPLGGGRVGTRLDEPSTPPSPTPSTLSLSRKIYLASDNRVSLQAADGDSFAHSAPGVAQADQTLSKSGTDLAAEIGDRTKNADTLKELSREELESMLQEADRIIRDKEQELSTFTAAGEELLNEFNSLRRRHESLVGRTSKQPSSVSPERSSCRSTLPAATPSPNARGVRHRRSWRASLGFPPPSESSKNLASTPVHRDRPPSELSYRVRDPSSDISPSATFRLRSTLSTPDGSPSALRRLASGNGEWSRLNAPKALLSPGSAAHELASLNQVNYALTLQLSELHADAEETQRDGRKRLRKLERELQAVREDLERAEQRNAMLETEAELAKERENELARSTRAGPTPRKPAVVPLSVESEHESPTFDWRVRRGPVPDSLVEDDNDSADDGPFNRSCAPLTPLGRQPAADAIFAHQPASPAVNGLYAFPSFPEDGSFLNTAHTNAGPRQIARSVSTSSLAPLPLPMQIDPGLERQADELVEQLMSKIDELQDTNEIIAQEREQMENRLARAQEEVSEWKERCEELAEENAMGRLGWEGPKAAIAWHSDDDADPETDAARPPTRPQRGRRILRRSRLLTQTSNTPTSLSSDIFSASTTGRDTPSPDSSPVCSKRTLGHELGECFDQQEPQAHDGGAVSLAVVRSSSLRPERSRAPAYPDEAPPVTTADDLLPLGSLRWAGPPEAEMYDQLEQAAEGLIPAWADDDLSSHHGSSGWREDRHHRGGETLDEPAVSRVRIQKRSKAGKGKGKGKGKARPLSSLGSDTESDSRRQSQSSHRRALALQRLGHEASVRAGLAVARAGHRTLTAESDTSGISSDYDELDHPLTRTSDYYPLALRSRYHPRMIATMIADSALRHIVTLITWIQFLVVLGVALSFALWQGPKKTLGLIDGRRRLA